MKNKLLTLIMMWMTCWSLSAQQFLVKGTVVTSDNASAPFATASLLRPDSTLVTGKMTDDLGRFSISPKVAGDYLLKISFIGFETQYHSLQLSENRPVVDFGTLRLLHGENLLGTATIQATAAKVEQVEDTTLFNAAAYRVPEGSTLEAIVKQLPGVEIEDNGTITWNGKPIKEFLVNGKDFFKGQADVALQNLPSDWISRIKAYEKRSEYAEQTGIDDGEEIPVFDIITKKELNQTIIANSDLSYGSEDRYFGKIFLSRFTDHSRVSAYGSMNNVADKSFGGKRKRGGGGLVTRKNAGTDFFWNNGKKKKENGRLEIGGNVHYNHVNTDVVSHTESEHFWASGVTNSFRSSVNRSASSSTNVNTSFRLEWHPDTMTTLLVRPSFSHSDSHNGGNSLTASFNGDPFLIDGMESPLDSVWAEDHSSAIDSMLVNRNARQSMGDRHNNNVSGSMTFVRKLNTKGRNVSFALSGGYNSGDNENFSISTIRYYNGRNGKYLNQYSHVPSTNWNYRLQAGYVEPLSKNWFAEVRYAFSKKYTDSDRSRYNLDRLDSIYGTWCDSIGFPTIGTLPGGDALEMVRDGRNSQYATYKYFDHTVNLNLRYNTKQVRFTAGVNFNPEKTKMSYLRPGQQLDTVITRHVFKVSPQLYFRYRFDKRNGIEARYRGWSSQPSMTDLLAVVDNSHPLNVTMGNPGLEPAWTNSLDLGYRGYVVERQQGMSVGFNFSQTKNAVSHLSIYDQSTGIRYHRPQNINGNWNVRTNYMFNTGLGKEKRFTLSTNTHFLYNQAVGYVSSFSSGAEEVEPPASVMDFGYYEAIFDRANIQKNTTKTFGMREKLNFAYRRSNWEVGTFGSVVYNHSRSDKRAKNDRDTWNYAYGLNTHLNFDFGLSFSSDIRVSSRRGYPSASMNTDEWLWNAQLGYSFLKRKAATISIQCFDILQQQSNVSHRISATQRSDSWNNDIHSYYMVHFIYKFRHIGGKKSKKRHGNKKEKSILDDEEVMQNELEI